MINVAICDDDKIFADSLNKSVKACFQSANIECCVKIFHSAQDLYAAIKTKYFDLLFLDIEVGADSGIALAHKIRDEFNNHKSIIVYVSNHKRYHNDGELYDAAPVRFISKPVKPGEIERVVEIVFNRVIKPASPDDYFTYSFKSDKHLLLKKDIYYFECSARNIIAVTKENRAEFISTMDVVQNKATEPYFVLIHRSFLINILHLKSYNGQYAIMANGDRLPVSDRQRKEAMLTIADFFNKRAGK